MNSLKQQIWEVHPYMTRVKKLTLLHYLPIAYERVSEVLAVLGYQPPNAYELSCCDIEDDFLLIKDKSNQLIAKAYVGPKPSMVGSLLLPDGTSVSEHRFQLITGNTPNEYGYIDSCRCSDCQHAQLQYHEQLDKERTERYQQRVEKIRQVSDRLPESIPAPRNVPPKPTMKITSPSISVYHDYDNRAPG
jgi:hypothetical protein